MHFIRRTSAVVGRSFAIPPRQISPIHFITTPLPPLCLLWTTAMRNWVFGDNTILRWISLYGRHATEYRRLCYLLIISLFHKHQVLDNILWVFRLISTPLLRIIFRAIFRRDQQKCCECWINNFLGVHRIATPPITDFSNIFFTKLSAEENVDVNTITSTLYAET